MTHTIPERPATVKAQMNWLMQGKRKCVLVTPGEVMPEIPEDMQTICSGLGLFIYRPDLTDASEVFQALATGKLGELLGYGVGCKPAPGSEIGAVVVRGSNGREKLSVVATAETRKAVQEAAGRMADAGDTVGLEPCEQVIAERTHSVLDNFAKLLPLQTSEELGQVIAAAQADGQKLTTPTHWMEKDGEIAGAAGVNSLPICTVWFHTKKMKARDTAGMLNVIENTFRMAGNKIVATLVDADSPFKPVMERLGYAESTARIYMKRL